jgi:hypothetical protein
MPEAEPEPKREPGALKTSAEDDVRAMVEAEQRAKWAERDKQPRKVIDQDGNVTIEEPPPGGWESTDTPEQRKRTEDIRRSVVESRVRTELNKRIVFPGKGKRITVNGKEYTVGDVHDSGERSITVGLEPTSKRAKKMRQLYIWPGGTMGIWAIGTSGQPDAVHSIEGVYYTNDEHPFHARAAVAKEKRLEAKRQREEEAKQRKYEEQQEKKRKKAEEKVRKAEERAKRRAEEWRAPASSCRSVRSSTVARRTCTSGSRLTTR